LKGCQDDKALERHGEEITQIHKRFYAPHMWGGQCCWSDTRKTYYNCKMEAQALKFSVVPDDHPKIMEALERDVRWLQLEGLMDYSMLVGTKQVASSLASDSTTSGNQPNSYSLRKSVRLEFRNRKFVSADPNNPSRRIFLYIGIIDFLQRWTRKKKIARLIKIFEKKKPTIPPVRYGKRFLEHFRQAIVADGIPLDEPISPVNMRLRLSSANELDYNPARRVEVADEDVRSSTNTAPRATVLRPTKVSFSMPRIIRIRCILR